MTETIVMTASVVVQFIAAAMALRLVRITERKVAWLLIAVAMMLLALRRTITLLHLLLGDLAHPLVLDAELVALVASGLMAVGMVKIAPFFRFARRAEATVLEKEQNLRAANQQLDAQNQQLTAANQQLRATEQQLRASNQQLEAMNQVLRTSEQQERAASAYSRSLIEASLDPLLTIDRDGRITDVNETTVQYTGVAREVLIGSNFSQYLTEPEKAVTGLSQVYSEGLLRNCPLTIRSADGQLRDVLCNASLYSDTAGKVLGVVAAARDITAHKRAEEQLRLNNAVNLSRLHLIDFSYTHSIDDLLEEAVNVAEKLTKSAIGFIHFVADDQQNLILQNWSTQTKEKFCKAAGKGEHYAIANAGVWVDCVRQRKPVIHNDYNSLQHKRGMPEGHAHVEREVVVPVVTGGVLKAILGVGNKKTNYTNEDAELLTLITTLAWEIVERRKAGEELSGYKNHLEELVEQRTRALTQSQSELIKAKEAAELANRTKSSFLANMSHEIRTPMNAILGFAQIIARDPALDQAHAVRIRSINRAGQHLLTLINDILDMAKIEAGVAGLNVGATSLNDMLEDLLMLLRSRAEAKGLRVIMDRDPSLPFHVLCDAAKLRQILVNVIGNAIKFTQSGGVAVRVRTEPAAGLADVQAQEDARAMRLIVEVEDSGPGIPPDELERIFSAFVQGRAGDSAGGTGLGLPISRRLAEMMGGSLTVQSEVGKGSCFRLEVLLEATDALPEAENPEPPPLVVGLAEGTGPKRILVVDDIRDNRDLLRDLLQSVGFVFREAHNGKEALAVMAEWSPDAVLMDMRMPVMDGYEATRRIKASQEGRAIPVIAITASAFRESEAEILQTGVSAYLRKPFKAEELFDVLGRCLGLDYVYAAEPAKAPQCSKAGEGLPDLTAVLPAELLRTMRQAVEVGDMEQFAELIGEAQAMDPHSARELRTLAGRYDYGRLMELLAEGATPHD